MRVWNLSACKCISMFLHKTRAHPKNKRYVNMYTVCILFRWMKYECDEKRIRHVHDEHCRVIRSKMDLWSVYALHLSSYIYEIRRDGSGNKFVVIKEWWEILRIREFMDHLPEKKARRDHGWLPFKCGNMGLRSSPLWACSVPILWWPYPLHKTSPARLRVNRNIVFNIRPQWFHESSPLDTIDALHYRLDTAHFLEALIDMQHCKENNNHVSAFPCNSYNTGVEWKGKSMQDRRDDGIMSNDLKTLADRKITHYSCPISELPGILPFTRRSEMQNTS